MHFHALISLTEEGKSNNKKQSKSNYKLKGIIIRRRLGGRVECVQPFKILKLNSYSPSFPFFETQTVSTPHTAPPPSHLTRFSKLLFVVHIISPQKENDYRDKIKNEMNI